jgi:hypothetical protein
MSQDLKHGYASSKQYELRRKHPDDNCIKDLATNPTNFPCQANMILHEVIH